MNDEKKFDKNVSDDYIFYFNDYDYSDDTNELIKKINDEKSIKKLTDIFDSLKNGEKLKDEKVKTESLDEAKERLVLDSEVIHTFTKGIESDQKIKRIYAFILLGVFIAQVVAFNVFFILVGMNILNFDNSTLNIYIVGAFLEIIFLIKIIVSYLFKDNITIPLSNVLEKNKPNK